MEPVTPFTLLVYVPAFLLMLAIYGNPFRLLFEKHLYEKNIALDAVERVSLTLASGAAVIPLIIMALSLLGNVLSVFTMAVLMVIFVMMNLFLYRERLSSFKLKLIKPNVGNVIVFVVFLAIFVFHFYPSLGLFVHPGDDPKLYSLITLRIVESGGYPASWGSFAPPAWYEEKVHLIIAGFAGVCAYFHLLSALSIEKTVLLITLTYTSLISFGVYFLAKRVFKNVNVALFSAFTFGMLIREPSIAWFSWGGHAELASLFLLLIVIGLAWELYHSNGVGNLGYLLYLAFLVSGMVLHHPLSVFYLAFCLIPYSIVFIFAYRRLTPVLKFLSVIFLSFVFVLPVFITAVVSEMAIMQLYESSSNPFWTPMISWNQTLDQMLYNVIWRFLAVYGVAVLPLLIVAINMLRNRLVDRKPIIFLAAWWITIFLVHENNPNGLYFIRFPFWYRIAAETNRIFCETSFPVSIIIGIGMSKILEGLRIFPFRGGLRKSLSKFKFINKELLSKKATWIVILICITQISLNIAQNSYSRGNSPVTKADISAFNWIKENTPQNATFFVLPNDAGQWIPVYTHRRVVIPMGVVTNNTLHYQYYYDIFPMFCDDPHNATVVAFLNYHNVNYVYIGSKVILPEIYGKRSPDVKVLVRSSVFKLVRNQSNTYIFKYFGVASTYILDAGLFTS